MILRCSLILLIVVFGFYLKNSPVDINDPDRKEILTLEAVVEFMERVHFKPREINDEFSAEVFDNYLNLIDPSQRFLTELELEQLEAHKLELDDALEEGNLTFFNRSLVLMDSSINRAYEFYASFIDEPVAVYSSDSVMLQANGRDFAASEEGLREYWQKLLTYEVITRIHNKQKSVLADEEPRSIEELEKEARKGVKKSFDNWFSRLKKLRREDRFEDYVNAITIAFDPHSNYFSPKKKEDFDMQMSGRYSGIGARLTLDGELTRVSEVIPGGPAWKGKELEAKDYIIQVAQEDEDPVDIRGWRTDDVVQLIRGEKGTIVILTVKKPNGEITDIQIKRDEVVLEESLAKGAVIGLEGVLDEVGYIKLPRFYADFNKNGMPGASEDIKNELEKLKAAEVNGVILDLRNNGGGSLSEVVDMAGLFIEEGPIVQVKSRGRKPYVLNDEDESITYSGPLIILVNHFSASASEIIAAALQDYGRAIIVGTTSTFGKGTVQRFHDLDRIIHSNADIKPLGEVKVTTQKFYRVNGGSTQLKGFIPDIILPDAYNYIKVGEKDYPSPLSWSEIDPVEYDGSEIKGLEKLIAQSKQRVKENAVFQLVEEKAKSLEEEYTDTTSMVKLNLDFYKEELARKEKRNERFRDMYPVNDSLIVENLETDLDKINLDSTTIAQNQEWQKALKKDVYLQEAIHIMKDLHQQQINTSSVYKSEEEQNKP